MATNMKVATSLLGGKRVGHFIGVKTLNNDETIQEAIDGGYVVGKKETIGATVKGVLAAMVKGISKDGNGRKVNKYISFQPVAQCKLDDVTDNVTPANCKIKLSANVLKEVKPDYSGWSFAVEGASVDTVNITSITTGEVVGQIVIGEDVDMNGFGLTMGTGDTLKWAVIGTDKQGTVAAEKITDTWTRITVLGNHLSELASSTYNGKMIVYTLKIGSKTVTKSATLLYNA